MYEKLQVFQINWSFKDGSKTFKHLALKVAIYLLDSKHQINKILWEKRNKERQINPNNSTVQLKCIIEKEGKKEKTEKLHT